MSTRARTAASARAPEPLLPSEGGLVVQTVALLGFSAWAFGGSVDWAVPWILALAAAGLPLLALRVREGGSIPLLPFLPALLWAAFVALALLNPSHAPLAQGGWAQREGWIRWLPTTVDRAHTLRDLTLLLPPLLQAGILLALLRTPRATRLIWSAIALNGLALAFVGASFHFLGADRLLGIQEGQEPTYFFATFFYKNHWAAYGALCAAAAFALAHRAWPAALAGHPPSRGRALLFGAAGLLIAITLPLPGSRAGALLAVALVLGFLGAMLLSAWRVARRRPRGAWLLGGAALFAAAILGAGVQAYAPRARVDLARTQAQLSRSLDGESLDIRLPLSRDTWRMTLARPWFGWGPGCFPIVFPVYQGNYLRSPNGRPLARFEAAHNDWFQLTAENGLLGAALVLLPATAFALRAWRAATSTGRWALAACLLLALYAWIDFPFHNRAILLLWAAMLASAPRLADPRPPPEPARGRT